MDGRVLAGSPSGVRDIALGMLKGFRSLQSQGDIDFVLAGEDHSFDLQISSRSFMHSGLPQAAARVRADRIFIPRQTKPLLSTVPCAPLFHDIGFFRMKSSYPHSAKIAASTRLAASATYPLSVSKFTADEMAASRLSGNVTPLPIQAIHPLKWQPDDKYILCIAVQEPHKNLVRLVQAWDAAATEDFRLVICGRPGKDSQNLARAVSQISSPKSVVVTSGLSDLEYLKLLSGCWAYIQPSLYEGLCIPALDLAAAGAPTAVSRSGNLGQVYTTAPDRVTFSADSTLEMKSSIESLLHDEDFREEASSWNKTTVRLTDWDLVAEAAIGGMA